MKTHLFKSTEFIILLLVANGHFFSCKGTDNLDSIDAKYLTGSWIYQRSSLRIEMDFIDSNYADIAYIGDKVGNIEFNEDHKRYKLLLKDGVQILTVGQEEPYQSASAYFWLIKKVSATSFKAQDISLKTKDPGQVKWETETKENTMVFERFDLELRVNN